MTESFYNKATDSLAGRIGVCVGLDTVLEKLPVHFPRNIDSIFEFNRQIVDATYPYTSAYKPNLAFYEALGAGGWEQLAKTIEYIPHDRLVIADAKRGDIGNTAKSYAIAMFETLGADAVTINPYLGSDAIEPFIENPGKGIFLLTVTSNSGARELQQLESNNKFIYQYVIDLGISLNTYKNIGFVVGATDMATLSKVVLQTENTPLLIPGIGAQGGDIDGVKLALREYSGPVFVNSSRGIIYASSEKEFALVAASETQILAEQLNN